MDPGSSVGHRSDILRQLRPARDLSLHVAGEVLRRAAHRRQARRPREGLTTQQWAVLGALWREKAQGGMSIGDLAKYMIVSRQNLSGLIGRMERDGHEILGDFSVNDLTHMPHYMLKMLQNMQRLDQAWIGSSEEDGGQG